MHIHTYIYMWDGSQTGQQTLNVKSESREALQLWQMRYRVDT